MQLLKSVRTVRTNFCPAERSPGNIFSQMVVCTHTKHTRYFHLLVIRQKITASSQSPEYAQTNCPSIPRYSLGSVSRYSFERLPGWSSRARFGCVQAKNTIRTRKAKSGPIYSRLLLGPVGIQRRWPYPTRVCTDYERMTLLSPTKSCAI